MDMRYTDIRLRRCGHCGAEYLPPGAGDGMCSDSCWMAARGRPVSQGDQLGMAFAAMSAAADRRQATRSTYRKIRSESANDAALAQYYAQRGDELAVVARARARSGRRPAGDAIRAAAAAYAASPAASHCSGPDCPLCTYGRQQRDAAGGGGEVIRRLCPLEDIHIIKRGQGGDGRTVEAYAAVFDQKAEIHDQMGDYYEEIDPGAWNGRLAEARRARGGLAAEIKVMFNHSMTRQGTPSDRWSLPVGKPLDIRPDSRGLLTITRYSDLDVLDRIKAGELTSQSFVGACLRSSPERRRGDRYRAAGGQLPVVRRMELGLKEYGPVLWPAYTGAEILGVRSE